MPDVSLDLELLPELWEATAKWINERFQGEPTGLDLYRVAATLLHVAAASWRTFEPPPDEIAALPFDRASFVDLARQMFDKGRPPGASVAPDDSAAPDAAGEPSAPASAPNEATGRKPN